MNKVYIYALAGTALIAFLIGGYAFAFDHGRDVERKLQLEANQEQLEKDATEITRLRKLTRERNRVLTKTVTEIKYVKGKCLDIVLPVAITNSLCEAYRTNARPEADTTLSVCRLPKSGYGTEPVTGFSGAVAANSGM